jgi:hypothetical protein
LTIGAHTIRRVLIRPFTRWILGHGDVELKGGGRVADKACKFDEATMDLLLKPDDYWKDKEWGNDNYCDIWCHIFGVCITC